jgi:hypothetical protein
MILPWSVALTAIAAVAAPLVFPEYHPGRAELRG